MAPHPSAGVAEELATLQAIYGSDFLVTSHTATSIRLNAQPFSFLLSLPPSYPIKPPEIRGTDPLWLQDSSVAHLGIEAFKIWVQNSFVPGQICLFDLLQDVRDILARELATR